MQITKKQFADYEYVRQEGKHNMWDVRAVCALTHLTKEEVMFIMNHYGRLKDYFELKRKLESENNADFLDKDKVKLLESEIKQIEVELK